MSKEDKPIGDLTKEEIIEALTSNPQPAVNEITESVDELKAMGIRDISEAGDIEKKIMNEALKNIQIQKTLNDIGRGSTDRRPLIEYLENHINFLVKISDGRSKKEVIAGLTFEHAKSILKISAKVTDVPDALIKKHLKQLKRKYK